jgi:hypothetical protein
MSYPYSVITEPRMKLMIDLGFRYGRRGGSIPNNYNLENYMSLYSYPVIDTSRPHYAELSKELQKNGNRWTIMLFHHIFPENATEWKTFARYDVKDSYSLSPLDFERYIRLIRNSDYYAGSIQQMGDYIKTAKTTDLKFSAYDNYYTISLDNLSGNEKYHASLTVELQTPWRYIQVDGSMSDGIYEVRDGKALFGGAPGATIIVRKLESEQQ